MSPALQVLLALAGLAVAVWLGMRITRNSRRRDAFRNDADEGL